MDPDVFWDIAYCQLVSMRFHPRNEILILEDELRAMADVVNVMVKIRKEKKCLHT